MSKPARPLKNTLSLIINILRQRGGNFAVTAALVAPILLFVAGGVIDFAIAYRDRTQLQGSLDAAVLAAVQTSDANAQLAIVDDMLAGNGVKIGDTAQDVGNTSITIVRNADGSVTATATRIYETTFLAIMGLRTIDVSAKSTAIAGTKETASANTCIYVLGNKSQAVLINSGANVSSSACEVDVQSTSNPAFIMNAGASIKTAKFCVKGKQYIKNGGTLTNLETGCDAADDPYAGAFKEPADVATCTTSGAKDGKTVTVSAGVSCNVNFNGSPTITFKPGLHIIKGTMTINSNATVIAEGVTFYFPDPWSKIQFNGGITMTGSAPTSGTYKGLFMFEKTSNASYNSNKGQLVFNGTKGETIQGIIYLPNRDVTYNSGSKTTSKISLVVNTLIMNSSKWLIEPYLGGGSPLSGAASAPRLLN